MISTQLEWTNEDLDALQEALRTRSFIRLRDAQRRSWEALQAKAVAEENVRLANEEVEAAQRQLLP